LGRTSWRDTNLLKRALVVLKKRMRRKQTLPRVGQRKKRSIRSAREPLVIATSITDATAKEIADIYALRWRGLR
jgi:hypothetical protein